MKVDSVLLVNGKVKLKGVSGYGDAMTMVSDDAPHDDLLQALGALQELFTITFGNESVSGTLSVRGVSHGFGSRGPYYVIHGAIGGSGGECKGHTHKLHVPYNKGWWEEHKRGDDPNLITEEDKSLIEKALAEADLFVTGKRGDEDAKEPAPEPER